MATKYYRQTVRNLELEIEDGDDTYLRVYQIPELVDGGGFYTVGQRVLLAASRYCFYSEAKVNARDEYKADVDGWREFKNGK